MKKIILSCLIPLLLSLTLAGCGPIYQTHFEYRPPANINAKRCIVQCQQNLMQCHAMCSNQNNQCEALAQQKAEFKYEAYVNRQESLGQPIKRNVQSFFDDTQCMFQSSCSCTPQYNQCYQLCGGQVITQRTCVAFCGKQT